MAIRCPLLALAIVGMLAAGVASADAASDKELAALIEQLGDPDFVVRDHAQEKLSQLGEKAYDALTIAANDSDLEVAARARYLLLTIELPVLRETDSDRVREALEDYTAQSTSDRLGLVRLLMGLPEGEGYRVACRLAHIEDSVAMSKFIATTILNRWPIHAQGRTRMGEAVDAELNRSGRKAANWLTTYAKLVTDPKSSLETWRELVEEEESLLNQRSPESEERLVAALLYDLAYWESQQDDASDLAQVHFERAQERRANPSSLTVYFYLDTANFYQVRGKHDWAVKVYGKVSELGYAELIPLAQLGLSEMLHDMGRNQEAAAALAVILELLDSRRLQSLDYMKHRVEQVRGRRHFFLACQARDDGDNAKYRTKLVEAIKNDPNELDALIALYRIPDLEKETRKNTMTMIENAAELLRQEAEASPDDTSAHNQFAWIVGNTTGNMQEALEHALRAIELSPESGAYLDTLAHVYFYGLKDYKKAAEIQAKAVKFMPHSGLIAQKYELFRRAAADRKAQPADDDQSKNDASLRQLGSRSELRPG